MNNDIQTHSKTWSATHLLNELTKNCVEIKKSMQIRWNKMGYFRNKCSLLLFLNFFLFFQWISELLRQAETQTQHSNIGIFRFPSMRWFSLQGSPTTSKSDKRYAVGHASTTTAARTHSRIRWPRARTGTCGNAPKRWANGGVRPRSSRTLLRGWRWWGQKTPTTYVCIDSLRGSGATWARWPRCKKLDRSSQHGPHFQRDERMPLDSPIKSSIEHSGWQNICSS